ncbi:nucleolin-like [Gossypium australe]|uniref:Nucleolin-like n=1 Tax=Gossypium australe TaxID=47621 RepID=A0A5B6UVL8_9ROSI|nr:nucleolin-like [Gossypium australe]
MENKRILFRFYSEVDLQRVIDGMPWSFNRHLIIFHRLLENEEPSLVPLWEAVFWVQIHNIPIGYYTEGMAKQMGDFIGRFVDYDASMASKGNGQYIRIRVMIDVKQPLKRKKRVCVNQNRFIYVQFQYERLSLFCFLCGRLGHSENFCPIRLTLSNQQVELGWDLSIRAALRRNEKGTSKWLREEIELNRGKNMEVDGETEGRNHEREITNERDQRRGMENMGRCVRHPRKLMGENNFENQESEEENGDEMEDIPIDLVDGKKRQRVIAEEGKAGAIRGIVELQTKISAANAMKIISWNVRGLGQSRTVKRLKNKLRYIQPQILFLMETKVTSRKMESIRRRCGFMNGIDVDAVGSRGDYL